MHKILSLCRPKNVVRWPFGFSTSLPRYMVVCGKCEFVDKQNSNLASLYSATVGNQRKIWQQHWQREHSRGNKVKLLQLEGSKENSNITDEEELHEIEVFGLGRLANIDVKQIAEDEYARSSKEIGRNKHVQEASQMPQKIF